MIDMEGLKERFLKTYANLPLALREDIILVLDDEGIKKTLTWNVAYIEVKGESVFAERVLKGLEELGLI